jgi:hypothetical protein
MMDHSIVVDEVFFWESGVKNEEMAVAVSVIRRGFMEPVDFVDFVVVVVVCFFAVGGGEISLLSESSFLLVPILDERSGDTPARSISAISGVRPLTRSLPSTNRTSAILSSNADIINSSLFKAILLSPPSASVPPSCRLLCAGDGCSVVDSAGAEFGREFHAARLHHPPRL